MLSSGDTDVRQSCRQLTGHRPLRAPCCPWEPGHHKHTAHPTLRTACSEEQLRIKIITFKVTLLNLKTFKAMKIWPLRFREGQGSSPGQAGWDFQEQAIPTAPFRAARAQPCRKAMLCSPEPAMRAFPPTTAAFARVCANKIHSCGRATCPTLSPNPRQDGFWPPPALNTYLPHSSTHPFGCTEDGDKSQWCVSKDSSTYTCTQQGRCKPPQGCSYMEQQHLNPAPSCIPSALTLCSWSLSQQHPGEGEHFMESTWEP